MIVCLGATAAQALLGRQFKVTAQRGVFVAVAARRRSSLATVHPSSILRAPDDETPGGARLKRFIDDLRRRRARYHLR